MAVYLITWDINKEKSNYTIARNKLISKLDQYTSIRDPGLDSVRFVSTTSSVVEVYTDIKKYLDDDDRLFIISLIHGNHQGWMNKEVWDWINARL